MRGRNRKVYRLERPLTEAETHALRAEVVRDLAALADLKAAQDAFNARVNAEAEALKKAAGAAVRQLKENTLCRQVEAVPDYDLAALTVTWRDPDTDEAIETMAMNATDRQDAEREP